MPVETADGAQRQALAPLWLTLAAVIRVADSQPRDALKAAVFARINRDRAAAGLPPVAWDEAASRVADAFCVAQVREASRGHFLMDGIPPYARTGFAGVFGVEAQNSVSWTTTARRWTP